MVRASVEIVISLNWANADLYAFCAVVCFCYDTVLLSNETALLFQKCCKGIRLNTAVTSQSVLLNFVRFSVSKEMFRKYIVFSPTWRRPSWWKKRFLWYNQSCCGDITSLKVFLPVNFRVENRLVISRSELILMLSRLCFTSVLPISCLFRLQDGKLNKITSLYP